MIPASCKKPAYCRDKDDFHKFFFSFVRMSSDNTEEVCADVCAMRALLHDYLALVISGKMKPYIVSEEEIARNEKDFQEFICEMNTILSTGGVPLEEDGSGRMRINYEKMDLGLEKLFGGEE